MKHLCVLDGIILLLFCVNTVLDLILLYNTLAP